MSVSLAFTSSTRFAPQGFHSRANSNSVYEGNIMTPVLTLIEERMRALLTERRGYARHRAAFEVNLPVGVSVPNDRLDPEADSYPDPIMGRTHDLSKTGLSLVLPSIHLGRERISAPDFPLR